MNINKIYAFKEIYTLKEAAQHLAKILSDEFSEADVLELALKGHLKLSVIFAKGAALAKCYPDEPEDKYVDHPVLGTIKNPKSGIFPLNGIFDLPMKGGEVSDVQYEQEKYIGIQGVKYTGMEGAYLEGQDGQLYQLQERFKSQINENLNDEEVLNLFQTSKRVTITSLYPNYHSNSSSINGNLTDGLVEYNDSNEMHINTSNKRTCSAPYSWRPARCLPNNPNFVIRRTALYDFLKRIDPNSEENIKLVEKENIQLPVEDRYKKIFKELKGQNKKRENNDLRIIGALVQILNGDHQVIDLPYKQNKALLFDIINNLPKNEDGVVKEIGGLNESTLQKRFAEAKKIERDSSIADLCIIGALLELLTKKHPKHDLPFVNNDAMIVAIDQLLDNIDDIDVEILRIRIETASREYHAAADSMP